ncbi:MAG: hypothetical protein FJ104_17115 [Deltaproteobacteria bacterium]|nr:hypothetical protein [Deltaproteobacteria bacterium]
MTSASPRAAVRPPGALLLHPAMLLAVGVLVINDHLLKATFPGWTTGKLSDAAGMVFFPALLVSLVEHAASRLGASWVARPRDVIVAAVLTGSVFGLVKSWPIAGDAYRVGSALLSWPVRAAAQLIARGTTLPPLGRATLVADPTDVLCVPFVAIAVWVAFRSERPSVTELHADVR